MFTVISDEISKASGYLTADDIIGCCPVYLFRSERDTPPETYEYFGEVLLESLERKEIFNSLNDAFVGISIIQKAKTSESSKYEVSITDLYGNTKYTLSEWLEHLSVEHHITRGITHLNIDEYSVLEENRHWWKGLLRTISGYKDNFLFLISCEDHIDELFNDVKEHLFCKTVEPETPDIDKLFKSLKIMLEAAGFRLSKEAAALVVSLINQNISVINYSILKNAAESMIWSFLMEHSKSSKRRIGVITEKHINPRCFEHNKDSIIVKHIGFNKD